MGEAVSDLSSGENEWPGVGRSSSHAPFLSFLGSGEHPLLACSFFGTRDGERCQDELCTSGALQVNANVLSPRG